MVEEEDLLTGITKTLLEDIKGKPLLKQVEYLFDTLWYDTGICDIASSFVRTAMESAYPKKDDSDYILYGKLYLLRVIGKDAPYETAEAVANAVDTILKPVAEKESEVWLEERLAEL